MSPIGGNKLSVIIYGKEYELDPGGLTPLEASQLASYVDQKMHEIADKLRLVDTQKIAVLAALNIAFELGSKPDKGSVLSGQDEAKIQGLVEALDKVLAAP
jgi:cell division protein ZapA